MPPASDRYKWDSKHASKDHYGPASKILQRLLSYLPKEGNAIDLGGGRGRHSILLAQHGLSVTCADISPVALSHADQAAKLESLHINTLETDLEDTGMPDGPWDSVVSFLFLWRPLIPEMIESLSDDGVLVIVQPTETNLERYSKPPQRFLLRNGELPDLVGDVDILHYEEGWLEDGRHDAVILCRKPKATE